MGNVTAVTCPAGGPGPIDVSLRGLFREIAGIPASQRERFLAERRISPDLRAEVESLLRYDSTSSESLTQLVSGVAQDVLIWGDGPVSRECGPYRLLRLLGSGGMGAVYLAERRDGEIEQQVAIKFLRAGADRPSWRERFLRERQLLANLNHPSITRLLDAGHTGDGRPYLVMEYVDGTAIDDYAAPLDLRTQLRLFLLVCDAVSHAHRHLIVHRDLKPSNILVDSSGHPKLLDFGIAKPLDDTAGQTQTVERLLTPSYASPEQLRGDPQTTATDIYSLGAVLYRILTGQPPREPFSQAAGHNREDPKLPRDIEHILRKALRQEPDERYASVDAFASDIRAFLESRPVRARSAGAWYRARKFLRRHGAAVVAATLAAAVLLFTLNMANRQRGLAQARFLQVRHLATKVLALDEVSGGVHSSSKAMHEIVAVSKEHLEALAADARTDRSLALDVGDAYSLLARAQGISMASNSEQRTSAQASLRKANVFVEPVLSASPGDRRALLIAARIGHDRMVLAENERRNAEAVDEGRKAALHLDRLLALGNLSPAEIDMAAELYYGIALVHKNQHLPEDGIRYARRSVEASRSSPNAQLRSSLALSMLADLMRRSGDLEGALVAIREARASLEEARFASENQRRSTWCRVLGREGKILGVPGGISLNRPDEAIPLLRRTFDLLEEWTQEDRDDAWSRLLFISVGSELGDTLRLRDPRKALLVYDHALRRVREVRDNPEARRGEAELLVASSYALRRLNRVEEAGSRIGAAFELLAGTGDYPAERVVVHEAAHLALRALGDHLAGTGQPRPAAEIYEELLAKITASAPDPRNDLPHAVALSQIFDSLAALHHRNGRHDRGTSLATLRLELWRHWDRKLPSNAFVRRQLRAASIS